MAVIAIHTVDAETQMQPTGVDCACIVCGVTDVFAIAPGTDNVDSDLFTVARGAAVKAWCVEHWKWRRV